jgi:uncharacterized protein
MTSPEVHRHATAQLAADHSDYPAADGQALWAQRTRVVLTPIAAPSILGLFGFFAATLMVGANLAGWYGDSSTPLALFPFALAFGGIAQLLAAMWSYKARDGLATGIHGAWGSFWIGYGILQLLVATHVLTATPLTSANPGFGFWFIGLAAITWTGFFGALGENLAVASVLAALAAGSTLAAIGFIGGILGVEQSAGVLFVISAGLAWYTASAMLLANSWGRTVVPVGALKKAANAPGRMATYPIEYTAGMPGVKVGQ